MASTGLFPHRKQNLGCLLISSPQGHSGKTTVAVGLCNILKGMGLSIQPFKKGPDYIDPSWLTLVSGRSCRNLDLFLMPQEELILSFQRNCKGADLAVVEGAMGLYDGLDSHGTTAEIARLLGIPILLVVNTTRMTSSIAAMVKGYQNFQKGVQIAGIILNYVSGSRHEKKLKDAVEKYCQIPVVGTIARDKDLHIAERHLGLIPSLESGEGEILIDRIGRKLESYLDLETIMKIARSFEMPRPFPLTAEDYVAMSLRGREATEAISREAANNEIATLPWVARNDKEELLHSLTGERVSRETRARIGVIRDRAFNFYYPENFEALVDEGAELVFINSLTDRLPPVDGLYIGGGFPEFFLEELENNRELREDIAWTIENGLPVYVECAGLIYLCRSISWRNRSYEMAGVIPADVSISERPQGHGYVVAEVMNENPFLPQGAVVRGHEFHHSKISPAKGLNFAYRVKRGHGIDGKRDGIVYKNLFASYVHLHALGTPEWAKGFVAVARNRKQKRATPLASSPLKGEARRGMGYLTE